MDEKTLILLPAYECALALPGLIARIRMEAPFHTVLIVDDGSLDNTFEAARKAGVFTLHHPENRGKGAALSTGFQYARVNGFDAVITLDADGQHDPSDLRAFFEADADLAAGCREFRRNVMPFWRICSNRLTSLLVRAVTGKRILDSQCGYRKVLLSALEGFVPRYQGYQFETELLLHIALRKEARIVNVPIKTLYSGEKSHIRHFRDIRQFLVALGRALCHSR
ncbi:MAG: glycosyltransferase family 2 protein [Fibrobacterota bacterium]